MCLQKIYSVYDNWCENVPIKVFKEVPVLHIWKQLLNTSWLYFHILKLGSVPRYHNSCAMFHRIIIFNCFYSTAEKLKQQHNLCSRHYMLVRRVITLLETPQIKSWGSPGLQKGTGLDQLIHFNTYRNMLDRQIFKIR